MSALSLVHVQVDTCWLGARRLLAGQESWQCQWSYTYLLHLFVTFLFRMILCLVKVARVSQTLRGAGMLAESVVGGLARARSLPDGSSARHPLARPFSNSNMRFSSVSGIGNSLLPLRSRNHQAARIQRPKVFSLNMSAAALNVQRFSL